MALSCTDVLRHHGQQNEPSRDTRRSEPARGGPAGGRGERLRRQAAPEGAAGVVPTGKLRIVTFLYTHCPDLCPLIASNDAQVPAPQVAHEVRLLLNT